MQHAKWDGLTPVDLIFPSFMFIMGMAVPLAVTNNKPVKLRNILRVLGLFLIG
jgi:predicted acyltransferase